MTEPRPSEINRRLAVLEAMIRDIREYYAWTHGWANHRSRTGDTLEGKTPAGLVNDEVGTIVISRDKAAARADLELAAEQIEEAAKILRSARFTVMDKIKQRGNPAPKELGPALASRQDKREAREAQQRREERGEAFGQ